MGTTNIIVGCKPGAQKCAFLPGGHLDYESAVTAQNDEFKGSFEGSRLHGSFLVSSFYWNSLYLNNIICNVFLKWFPTHGCDFWKCAAKVTFVILCNYIITSSVRAYIYPILALLQWKKSHSLSAGPKATHLVLLDKRDQGKLTWTSRGFVFFWPKPLVGYFVCRKFQKDSDSIKMWMILPSFFPGVLSTSTPVSDVAPMLPGVWICTSQFHNVCQLLTVSPGCASAFHQWRRKVRSRADNAVVAWPITWSRFSTCLHLCIAVTSRARSFKPTLGISNAQVS